MAPSSSSFRRFVRKATSVACLRREVASLRSALAMLRVDVNGLRAELRETRARVFDVGYLYVLRDTRQTDVYKVGRTGDVGRRLQAYPGNSMELVVSRCCDDVARRERMLVRHLKRHNEHCPWIGNEYFRAADPSELVAALDTVAPLPPPPPAQD